MESPSTVIVLSEPPVKTIKMKKILARKPIVKLILEEPVRPSVWLSMRRVSKFKASPSPPPINWDDIEDISDDETDSEAMQMQIKAFAAEFRQQEYENQLADLQSAGLFLSWSPEKLLKPHAKDPIINM